MAEIISIRVNVNDGDYKRTTERLLEIQKYVETLNKTPVNIKINIDSGAQQATQNLAANLQNTARNAKQAASAVGKLNKAQEKEAAAAEKAAQAAKKAQQQRIQALIDAARKSENLADKEEKRKEQELIRMKKLILREQQQYEKAQEKEAAAAEKAAQKEAEAAEKAAQREAAAKQRASEASVTLERQYSNLIRQIQNLKAQYPEGTFDAIEQQAREARDELRNLDRTSEDYANNVGRLGKTYQGLQRDLSNTREETNKLDKVTESLWMNIQKFARWYVIGNVFTKILNSFREALSTMREVDTELANIQKVTDRTDAEMQKLAESAYSVASAYGVSAQAYLESAAEFAKAGFGDRAEELAEAAIKTQLVGDVSADVADKFLLASNAAWKMDGNMQLLNKTLDAANIIENNYATSIEKLAAGMPIVASVAANAGMTFEETIAALGTITSVTQETGTKSSTALRALILNIIGAVGEYEDGIEVTEESVKSLDGILQVYAKDAMKAAKEAGTVINPMEAIAALAKASEEGLVNQAELFEILSSLGGKLRTNQLISLVQNYDMFLEMLDKTKESAGSADKELGVMLDTWEAKTNILQNTWTEFIANTINSNFVKSILDISTAIVDFADNAGLAATAAAGLFTIFKGTEVVGALKSVRDTFKNLGDVLRGTTSNMTAATTAAGLMITAVSAFIMIYRQVEQARRDSLEDAAKEAESIQNQADKYDVLTEKLENENLSRDELITLLKKSSEKYNEEWDSINDVNELREIAIGLINEETKAKARQYTLDHQADYRMSQNILSGDRKVNIDSGGTNLRVSYAEAIAFYEKAIDDAMKAEHMTSAQARALGILTDEYKRLKKEYEESTTTVDAYETALSILDGTYQNVEESGRGVASHTRDLGDAQDDVSQRTKSLTEKLQEASETATEYDTAIGGVVDAMEDFGAGSIEVYNAMKSLEETIPGSTDKLYDFDTATVIAGDDIFTSKEAMLDFIDSSKQLEFSQAISELEDLAAGYWDVAGAALAAMANQQAAAQMAGVLAFTTGGTQQQISQVLSAGEQIANLRQQKAEWDAYITTLRGRKDYRSGGSSGSSSGSRDYTPKSTAPERTTDEELERLKAIVSWEKAELNYLQASGKSLEDINKKRKSIQEALHEQAEYMRSALALMDDTNSTEAERKAYEQAILDLSTEWWSIQKDINDDLAKAEEDRIKALEEEKKLLEEQKKLQQEMFDTIKATVDEYLKKQTSEEEKQLSLLEKQLAVKKAEEALENAKKERTVRYYNAATDQWEWRANAKNVKSAEDALERAQDDLTKYSRSQAYAEFTSAWEDVSKAIKSGETTFQDAYEYMYGAMKDIQDTYGVNLGKTLENSIGGFKTLNGGIDTLTTEVTEKLQGSVGKLDEQLTKYEGAVGALRTAFESAFQKKENGEVPAFETAVGYLSSAVENIAKLFGVNMTGAVKRAIDGFDKTNGSIEDLWVSVIKNLMKVNSARWFDATPEERELLHAQNDYLGNLIGAEFDKDTGYWYLKGKELYESQEGVSYDSEGNLISSPSGGGGSTPTSSTVGGLVGGGGSSSDGPTTARYVGPVSGVNQDALTKATTEEVELITNMLGSAAAGDWSTAASVSNTLTTAGKFPSYIDENGLVYGFVTGVSGATAGSRLLINGNNLPQTGIEPGAVFADAFGNVYQVGSDGHSTTKIDPSILGNNWERWAAWASSSNNMPNMPNVLPNADPAKVALYHAAAANPAWKEKYAYDSGGILKGVGGIKATARDELILGPELTQKATKLAGSADSNRVLDLVGGLLGAAAKILPFSQNTVGSQYNGAVYQLGNVTMTEGQARTTSVYELAHMASGLGIFNNRT